MNVRFHLIERSANGNYLGNRDPLWGAGAPEFAVLDSTVVDVWTRG